MGFRFSKRISIIPGVRINLSKSGASLSVGPRGASVTVGKRGVFGNVGVPGTGLSYRERLDKPAASTKPRTPTSAPLPERVVVKMIDDQVAFFDGDDAPLEPLHIPAAKKALGDRLPAFVRDHEAARNVPSDQLTCLHHDVPHTVGSISSDASKPLVSQYPDQPSYMAALMSWRAQMANAGPGQEALETALLESLGKLQWPFETNIAISLKEGRLLLDVDVPEIEDMPTSRWTADVRLMRLNERSLPKTRIASLYLEHVCSLIVRLAGHSMAVSTAINSVGISAYTQRSGSIGSVTDEYVATFEIDRDGWSRIDLAQIGSVDPQSLLRRFAAKIETNSRGILQIQQPLS